MMHTDRLNAGRDGTCCTLLKIFKSRQVRLCCLSEPNKGTIEGQATSGGVLAHPVLRHTLVSSCVFLLEAGDLQHGIRVLHFDFTGEGDAISPLPGDLWHGARRARKKETSSKTPCSFKL